MTDEPVCLLVRLRAGRCFYADPTSQPQTVRPRRHGAKFVCDDPTTWPEPTDQWSTDDLQYGHVQLQAWSGLHPIPQQHAEKGTHAQPHARPLVRGTLLRQEVDHLPRPTKTPVPLWFWWWGTVPPDLGEGWQADVARYSIEHTFRFFTHTRSSGRRPSCAGPLPPTVGPGCWCWPSSNCAWPATRSPMCACPGSGRSRRNGAPPLGSDAAFRRSWHHWAVP